MNKNELSAAIAAKAGLTRKDAEAAICAMSDIIAESLKNGEKVQIVGFGAFEVKERPARKARNPTFQVYYLKLFSCLHQKCRQPITGGT